MKRHHFTLTELLTVIAIIAILAGIGVPATVAGLRKAAKGQAKHDCSIIRLALEQYMNTYVSFKKLESQTGGETPEVTKVTETIDGKSCSWYTFDTSAGTVMNALTGTQNAQLNPRGIKFLDKRPDAADSAWLDPWGHVYHVIVVAPGGEKAKYDGQVLNGRVFVYSDGLTANTSDDIKSWSN